MVWSGICRAEHTRYTATNKPKLLGVTASWEAPPTGGRGGQSRVTLLYTYIYHSAMDDDINGDIGVISFWYICRVFIFGLHVVYIDTPYYKLQGRELTPHPVPIQVA